jgi:outer membrane protein assembly factor BamB
MRRSTIPSGVAAAALSILSSCVASSTVNAQAAANSLQQSAGAAVPAAVDVLTQHNDPQRSAANLNESILTPAAVKSGRFGLLFDWQVDGQIYAQPLYVSQVAYQGRTIDMVVVATMNNSVYAFEAPASNSAERPSPTPLWHVDKSRLGEPLPYNFMNMTLGVLGRIGLIGHNISPLIGITSTPVIDRKRGRIYVVAKSGDQQHHYFNRLFALNLLDGRVEKQITIAGQVLDSVGAKIVFNSKMQLQRPGLLEANDRIYLGFGSHEDTKPYHGWVLAYDADSLAKVATYCTTCSRKTLHGRPASIEGGVWQAGGGLASDPDGNIIIITGNGTFDPATTDRGDSFIELDKNLAVLGSFTPSNYRCLDYTDSDLGSAGPVFDKDNMVLFGGGKEAVLYALTSRALHGANVGIGHPPGAKPCDAADPVPAANGPGYWSTQAAPTWELIPPDMFGELIPETLSMGFHHIHGSPAIWHVHAASGDRTMVYLSAERDLLRAQEFHDGFINGAPPGQTPTDTYHSRCSNSGMGMPGGFLTISANGDDPTSGIVWAAMPIANKNALNHVVQGILRAYEAIPDQGNEIAELWNSSDGIEVGKSADCKDGPAITGDKFEFAKFVPPTVAEGKVYLATFSSRLAVYGLKSEAPAAGHSQQSQ